MQHEKGSPNPFLPMIRHTERQVNMKFPYHVTHNGVDYAPNEEVPIEKSATKETVVKSETVEIKAEETQKFSKTEINRMPIDELKKTAKSEGIASAESKSGAELKKALIEKLGL